MSASAMSAARELAPVGDLLAVTDLARGIEWAAVMGSSEDGQAYRWGGFDSLAAGTVDALLWALAVTEVRPVSGPAHGAAPSAADVDREARVVDRDLGRAERMSPEWLYLGGVLDGLDYAQGVRRTFWWEELPHLILSKYRSRPDVGSQVSHD
jgi:hypothetical protein